MTTTLAVALVALFAVSTAFARRLAVTRNRIEAADAVTVAGDGVVLDEHVGQALRRIGRQGGLVAVLHCEIDDFEEACGRRGHVFASSILRRVTTRLEDALRPGDTLLRKGRAGFVVCCEGLEGDHEAFALAEALHLALTPPFTDPFGDVVLTASVGVSIATPSSATAQHLLRNADAAMRWGSDRRNGLTTIHRAALRDAAQRELGVPVAAS